MSTDLLIRAPVGLLPVLIFLGVLLYMDSYKLVALRTVLWVIVAGGLMALLAFFANGLLMSRLDMSFAGFSRYVAPLSEEALKGLIIVILFRLNRI